MYAKACEPGLDTLHMDVYQYTSSPSKQCKGTVRNMTPPVITREAPLCKLDGRQHILPVYTMFADIFPHVA